MIEQAGFVVLKPLCELNKILFRLDTVGGGPPVFQPWNRMASEGGKVRRLPGREYGREGGALIRRNNISRSSTIRDVRELILVGELR